LIFIALDILADFSSGVVMALSGLVVCLLGFSHPLATRLAVQPNADPLAVCRAGEADAALRRPILGNPQTLNLGQAVGHVAENAKESAVIKAVNLAADFVFGLGDGHWSGSFR
jgi:hypothetical protein